MSPSHLRKSLHPDSQPTRLSNRSIEDEWAEFEEKRETGHKSFSGKKIASRFKDYLLLKLGVPEDHTLKIGDIPQHLEEYLAYDVKQIAALEHLTNDIHRPSPRPARPYRGAQLDGPPLDYLVEHYDSDIADRALTTGTLRAIDPKLYHAFNNELRKTGGAARPGLLQGTYEQLDERRRMVADLFGAKVEDAFRFMNTLKDRSARAR